MNTKKKSTTKRKSATTAERIEQTKQACNEVVASTLEHPLIKERIAARGRSQNEIEMYGREVTLSVTIRVDDGVTDADIKRWKAHGEVFKRLLSSRDCPASFRQAFTNIYHDHLINKLDTTHPGVVGAFFPLVMVALQGNEPCTSDAILDALVTLRETLAGELTEKILAKSK